MIPFGDIQNFVLHPPKLEVNESIDKSETDLANLS